MSQDWDETRIPVNHAVSIVVLASAIGGPVGYLFTIHLIESFASELEAVWLTTVVFASAGLYLWGAFRS
ncbi:hypothetical protein [Halobellus litoreus]|uniref:Uncharacterized protein n=1 Tax=Halobellus litoreus TaxID=755310 RepID=A0ABD6E4G2_9EURY|nr:hypothetical protein [Halobellus litoreus]